MTSPSWATALEKTLNEHEEVRARPIFQVATVDEHGIPHVRSQVYRETLALDGYPYPLLLSSTDIRTPKVTQLLANPHVEICWWIDATQEQFRISAQSYIISGTEHPLYEKCKPDHMAATAREDRASWETRRRQMFDAMSPPMKAGWLRPAPGSKLGGGREESKAWVETIPKQGDLKTDEEKKNWENALANFALMVFMPSKVDYVELGVVPNRRRMYVRDGEAWTEEDVTP
ncbi:hypothetical protein OE88DRAFT_1662424 [Heliocybe sulcata]|uniref:Pyridoxamine 5'-phosphate oxidase Alr4036 family FMN-binding domain-containing protein n=1 Tax=Heliocybe sulcata TaxID=5364 RepID=A0A5C3MW81_9AGAM|nr:hypothetical protein OE88DRAFT_1662424 [Heliocybe sulcata]